jgi:hypothetical protein
MSFGGKDSADNIPRLIEAEDGPSEASRTVAL